jgi:hypothetical protein
MEDKAEVSKHRSASNALYLTRGYLDPSVVEGGGYSAVTDGWALGITLLVSLTGRSPLSIINRCEDDFDEDFTDIEAAQLADAAAGWPPHTATAIKDLVRSASRKCLCHPSNRKKLALTDAQATLAKLVGEGGGLGTRQSAASSTDHPSVPAAAAAYIPTPLSMQRCARCEWAAMHKRGSRTTCSLRSAT